VALATPRTRLLAGSVATGKLTYVTRSRLFGFPDYTTVSLLLPEDGGPTYLHMFARLRFGLDDLGVNGARVRDWAARGGLQ
jgi:uncharacterized protein (DUF1499 family)